MPDHPRQLGGRVVDDALADGRAVAVDLDRVAGLEVALDGGDPDRQQAGAALAQDPRRALVDHEPAVGRLRVLEPELEARRLAAPGRRSGCRPPRRRRPRRSVPGRSRCRSPPGSRPRSPSPRRRPCCASRPSRRPRCGRRSPAPRARRSRSTSAISSASGSRRGSARVEAVDVGQQDQQPGVEQDRDLGGEEVVVAEGDLVGRGRVVLVDDRHHAPLDQPPQGLARVQVVGAGGDVGGGQQHLGGAGAVLGQPLS